MLLIRWLNRLTVSKAPRALIGSRTCIMVRAFISVIGISLMAGKTSFSSDRHISLA